MCTFGSSHSVCETVRSMSKNLRQHNRYGQHINGGVFLHNVCTSLFLFSPWISASNRSPLCCTQQRLARQIKLCHRQEQRSVSMSGAPRGSTSTLPPSCCHTVSWRPNKHGWFHEFFLRFHRRETESNVQAWRRQQKNHKNPLVTGPSINRKVTVCSRSPEYDRGNNNAWNE